MTRVPRRPAAWLQSTHVANVSTMEETLKGQVACFARCWNDAFLLVVRVP
jgi:hypothetical protein